MSADRTYAAEDGIKPPSKHYCKGAKVVMTDDDVIGIPPEIAIKAIEKHIAKKSDNYDANFDPGKEEEEEEEGG